VLRPTAPVASANCCVCISTVALRDTGWLLLPAPRLLLGVAVLALLLALSAAAAVVLLTASACFSTEQ
jgi:hypothetical protein